MKRSVLAVLLCAIAGFAVFDFVSTLPPCSPSEQKQPEQRSEERCGFTQSFTYRMIDADVDWIDRRHDFVTAAATMVIALFTGTLWLANMKIKVVVHDAEEGGFWAEVPAIPGCATQGETMDELLRNLHEAIEGCLSVDVAEPKEGGTQRILEIAV